jgi:hypothetical protein
MVRGMPRATPSVVIPASFINSGDRSPFIGWAVIVTLGWRVPVSVHTSVSNEGAGWWAR